MKTRTEKALAYGALALAALLIYNARKKSAAPGGLAAASAASFWASPGASAMNAAAAEAAGPGGVNLSGWGVMGFSDQVSGLGQVNGLGMVQ